MRLVAWLTILGLTLTPVHALASQESERIAELEARLAALERAFVRATSPVAQPKPRVSRAAAQAALAALSIRSPVAAGAFGLPLLSAAPMFPTVITASGGSPLGIGVAPSGCTDNTIIRADGTAGNVQCSSVTIADTTGGLAFTGTSPSSIGFPQANSFIIERTSDGLDLLTIAGSSGASSFFGDVTFSGGANAITLGANGTIFSDISTGVVMQADSSGYGFGFSGDQAAMFANSVARITAGVTNVTISDGSGNTEATFLDAGTTGGVSFGATAKTIADNGNGGTAAADATLPVGFMILVTCNDANGCDWTPTETGATDGVVVNIVNVSANTLNVIHAAGQVLLNGGNSEALGQNDSLTLTYSSSASAWIQVGATGNN